MTERYEKVSLHHIIISAVRLLKMDGDRIHSAELSPSMGPEPGTMGKIQGLSLKPDISFLLLQM